MALELSHFWTKLHIWYRRWQIY